MKRLIKLTALMLCCAMLTACAHTTVKQDELTNNISPMDVTAEAAGDLSPISDLGIKLLAAAAVQGETNPVLSPLSAYICLAMAMNGADGDTLAAFEQVMGADLQYVNLLCRTVNSQLHSFKNTDISMACSAWADDTANINEDYLKAIVTHMDSEVYQADLASKQAINAINSWVKDKTNGLIPMLHEQPYHESTMLVLLNALYMDAKWASPFEGYATHDSTFTTADGEEIKTPCMNKEGHLLYINTEDASGILLPYKDEKLAFIALMPEGDLGEYLADLTAEDMLLAIESAADTFTYLRLPKFEFEYQRTLTDDLSALGLTPAFDPDLADFAAMGSGANGPLYLSTVFQKVRIHVNEEGTEAAAVTEAAAAEGAAMVEPVRMVFDHPFLYGVVDIQSGMPLFLGTYDIPINQK